MPTASADRSWIIRPDQRLRTTLAVCPYGRPRRSGEVVLNRMGPEKGAIEISDLMLEIGQRVTLCFDDGDTLKGAVRWASDTRAGIVWESQLSQRRLCALRLRHMGFLSDVPNLDLAARRSVA